MNHFSENIAIELRPSRYLLLLLLLVHAGMLIVLWAFSTMVWIALALAGVCVLHFIYSARRYALLLTAKAIKKISVQNGRWHLMERSGRQLSVQLLGDTVVTAQVIIANFKETEQKRRRSVILLRDSATPEDLRQLRVRLLQLKT